MNPKKQKPLIRGAEEELGETGPGTRFFPGPRPTDGLLLYAGYSGLGGHFALPGLGRSWAPAAVDSFIGQSGEDLSKKVGRAMGVIFPFRDGGYFMGHDASIMA